jgi:hypothetical protein
MKREKGKKVCVRGLKGVLFLFSFFSFLAGCRKDARPGDADAVFPFASFREIPGVTAEEINAVEALRERYSYFVYGMIPTSEAFSVYLGDGEVGGFAARSCEWLTNLFGVPFRHALYD